MDGTQVDRASSLAQQLYALPAESVQSTELFRTWISSAPTHLTLLSSIPAPESPSYRPLHLLYVALSKLQPPWPTLDLINHHARLLKYLPKDSTTQDPGTESAWVVAAVEKLVKEHCPSIDVLLPKYPSPALRSSDPEAYITHRGLRQFVDNFALPIVSDTCTKTTKPVVCIALPNGPLLAAASVAVMTSYIAAPINPATGPEQFKSDFIQSGAGCILTSPQEYASLRLEEKWVEENNVTIVFVEWTHGDDFKLSDCRGQPLLPSNVTRVQPNLGDEICLVLFTSGTSGTKKVVPISTYSLVSGVAFVVESWGLKDTDVCLNMMPLYHVGGLVRNIFAPLFSGGSSVCCAVFDPTLFWDVVENIGPTWYYASPSMHTVILSGARSDALRASKIRLVCNAAGGLLPSLACQLRDTFNSIVLPSYGMTECMPISTPPLDYQLDRPGTSGISAGPEVTVLDLSDQAVPPNTVGRICVRGQPVFRGYLQPDGQLDKSCFNEDGWFDTGDLGYLDQDYLYITGRSKEVINRGGELISPFEVENAIMAAAKADNTPISGRVSQALAFSVNHDILQEVVAIVLVTPPVKWPCLICYMDDLPKNNNKVLRIKLAERLEIDEVMTNNTPYIKRHREARCPPADTSLSAKISSQQCQVDCSAISNAVYSILPPAYEIFFGTQQEGGSPDLFIGPKSSESKPLESAWVADVKSLLDERIHGYMVPNRIHLSREPFPRNELGVVDEGALRAAIDRLQDDGCDDDAIKKRVSQVFAQALNCDIRDINSAADFFTSGGDSLRAGQLLSLLRTEFGVQVPIPIIFNDGTVERIADKVTEMMEMMEKSGAETDTTEGSSCPQRTRSSSNPLLMLIQLLPLAVFYPIRRGCQWTLVLVMLTYLGRLPLHHSVPGRLLSLVLSITFASACVSLIAPFIGIAVKWILIGRYKAGMYPMWGAYHTRWWMAQKIISLCGHGVFKWNNTTTVLYYRLMGAKIGRKVTLDKPQLGEYDLLDIRDGAVLSKCVCRPFAVESNTCMYLAPITIEQNASIGISTVIAPGSTVPVDTCLGPNSSSWEMQDADESFRDGSASLVPALGLIAKLAFIYPIVLLGWFLSLTPWIGGLIGLVISSQLGRGTPLRSTLAWFAAPNRVGYHYLALALRTLLSPFILFGFSWLVKLTLDALFGRLGPSPASKRGAVEIWRTSLIKALLPVRSLHNVTSMFGQHYEATSVALRMMGAQVGKRVYWPGTGPDIGDYHLLHVGNDVIFGTRAHIVTSDASSSECVSIKDEAMIADRVVLLPGVTIGKKTTMGSGALTKRGGSYGPEGTYMGSKGGDAICLSTGRQVSDQKKETLYQRAPGMPAPQAASADTLVDSRDIPPEKQTQTTAEEQRIQHPQTSPADTFSPFGRAFYLKQAPFYVWGSLLIFVFSSFTTLFTALFWNLPNIAAIQLVDYIYREWLGKMTHTYDIPIILGMVTLCIAIFTTVQSLIAIATVVGAKWILLGRRLPGNYDWDKSSYCQRWQLYLTIEQLRRYCYSGQGILGLLTGTEWIVWYFRLLGASIGKNCALFANGSPSLMFTEPDLITLGDRVAIDDASVVAHINTRGKFDLNRLEIGDRCVLRTGSRLLSGASMKNDACLLEHTLIMSGDVVQENWTMQVYGPLLAAAGTLVLSAPSRGDGALSSDGSSSWRQRRQDPAAVDCSGLGNFIAEQVAAGNHGDAAYSYVTAWSHGIFPREIEARVDENMLRWIRVRFTNGSEQEVGKSPGVDGKSRQGKVIWDPWVDTFSQFSMYDSGWQDG
ncbi:hypothetical protein QQZ08_001129 [Neonectria magnoliae]|uniref:Carrier domain-containing protein n=1 Tax=Neonectria magnoliae TaxID=2732573 RepID=A0ABR1IGS3_9HYPO